MDNLTEFLIQHANPIVPPISSSDISVEDYLLSYFTDGYTMGNSEKLLSTLEQEENMYLCEYKQIALHSLQYAISETQYFIKKEQYIDILTRINEFYGAADTDDPYTLFCKNCLFLESAFFDVYQQVFSGIMRDLREIHGIISEYEDKEMQLMQKQNRSLDYEIRKCKFIIQHYQKYQNEIIEFITISLNHYIITRSQAGRLKDFTRRDYPYSYGGFWDKMLHNPKRPHTVMAKFSHLPIKQGQKIEKLYKEDQLEYYEFIRDYISDKAIVETINSILQSHHFLEKRKAVIFEAIGCYETKKWYSFVSTIIPQIEGLFRDFCEFTGINVKNDTLFFTVEKITQERSLLGYQYFLYELPMLRNKVAHGTILEHENLQDISNELILDLHSVLSKFTSEYLPQNETISLIEQADFEYPHTLLGIVMAISENVFLLQVLDNKQESFVDFYGLHEKIKAIKEFVNSAAFSNLVKIHISEIKYIDDIKKWQSFSKNCNTQTFFNRSCLSEWKKAIGRKAKELSSK